MKERPILFSTEMRQAIREGRKTQTRRVMKPQPEMVFDGEIINAGSPGETQNGGYEPLLPRCPYGVPGDRLWVRETWRPYHHPELWTCVQYKADMECVKPTEWTTEQGFWCENWAGEMEEETRWRPSIHMPRWASRITLEVTAVRPERLHDISEADAEAEGVLPEIVLPGDKISHIAGFYWVWETINHDREGCDWSSNPWVWAVTFRRIEPSSASTETAEFLRIS